MMKVTKELLDRYFKQKCTPEEIQAVDDCMANNPEIIDELFLAIDLEIAEDTPYAQEEELFQKIQENISRESKRNVFHWKWVVTAIAILSLGILFYMFQYREPINAKNLTHASTVKTTEPQESNLYFINSEIDNMNLVASDGSKITLYPKSEIRYAENFSNKKERIIFLKGKAKFEVAHDKSKPFRVIANGITTTALGTEFIVDELKRSEIQISLLSGAIDVESNSDYKTIKRTFSPKESIIINPINGKILSETRQTSNQNEIRGSFDLINNKIYIKNLSLNNILTILENNYNIHFVINPSLIENKYYSGVFLDHQSSVNDIIKDINYLHKLQITIEKL